MTLEECTADLEALETAVAALGDGTPALELVDRLSALDAALRALKLEIGRESARLAQLQAGLGAGIGPPPGQHFDHRG